MLKSFLAHHIDRAKRGELSCIKNCHVYGLWSVMLHDEPGNRIRLFYADTRHHLYKNARALDRMSLGYHAHHSDIRLIGVHGFVKNVETPLELDPNGELRRYRYSSKILTGESCLKELGGRYKDTLTIERILGVNDIFMPADRCHTIIVPRNEDASWIVIEGKQDPSYVSECYTDNTTWNSDNLYINCDSKVAFNVLNAAFIGNEKDAYR